MYNLSLHKDLLVSTLILLYSVFLTTETVSSRPKIRFCHQSRNHIQLELNDCHTVCQRSRDASIELLKMKLLSLSIQIEQDKNKLEQDIFIGSVLRISNFSLADIPVQSNTRHQHHQTSSYVKAYDKLNEITLYRLIGITEYAIEEGLGINWNRNAATMHYLRCALRYKTRHLQGIRHLHTNTCEKSLRLNRLPDSRLELGKWMYSVLKDNLVKICEIAKLLNISENANCNLHA